MFKKWLLLSLSSLVVYSASAQTEEYRIDSRHSSIGFSIKIAGGLTEVDGSFTDFNGNIFYDARDLAKSSLQLTIKTASINTGVVGRDEHLRTEDFFDADKFPEIVFKIDRIERRGAQYLATGPLTMHGVTREIALPFKKTHEAPYIWIRGTPTIAFQGELTLNRKDFGIQGTRRWNSLITATGELAMADDVDVHIKIIAEGEALDRVLFKTVADNGSAAGLKQYLELKDEYSKEDALNEDVLNRLAYALLDQKKLDDAITFFELGVKEYPTSANAYDSLGEAYKAAGKTKLAIKNYKKSLELNPDNRYAVEMLKELERR